MKRCLACDFVFNSHEWACPKCDYCPRTEAGVPVHDENLLNGCDSFSTEGHSNLHQIEDDYFWFKARKKLLCCLYAKYCFGSEKYIEIGCGNGTLLQEFSRRNQDLEVYGSEIYLHAIRNAKERAPGAIYMQMNIENIPFVDEFDSIGCFDVIEHVDNDTVALQNLNQALAPGGGLIVTVPQHMFLWSEEDVEACHRRRYSSGELKNKLQSAGFEVIFLSSFVSCLLPLVYISRRFFPSSKGGEFEINKYLNGAFYGVCSVENYFISKGMRFPFGVSLVAVARKAGL